jgi:hypothetical protein
VCVCARARASVCVCVCVKDKRNAKQINEIGASFIGVGIGVIVFSYFIECTGFGVRWRGGWAGGVGA